MNCNAVNLVKVRKLTLVLSFVEDTGKKNCHQGNGYEADNLISVRLHLEF